MAFVAHRSTQPTGNRYSQHALRLSTADSDGDNCDADDQLVGWVEGGQLIKPPSVGFHCQGTVDVLFQPKPNVSVNRFRVTPFNPTY